MPLLKGARVSVFPKPVITTGHPKKEFRIRSAPSWAGDGCLWRGRSCDLPWANDNLTVITRAHATEVLFQGKRAVGVSYRRGGRSGKLQEVRARREVVLSGGAFNSPQLLQLSGVRDPEFLKSLGIDVKLALKGVGENLRDHYAPRFTARVKNTDSINERSKGFRLFREIIKWGASRKGILSLSPTLVYCFWRSNPDIEISDLQMTFTPASYKEGVQSELDDFPGMTIAAWQQRPESSGYVRAASADPFEKADHQPKILGKPDGPKGYTVWHETGPKSVANETFAKIF